MIEPRFTGWYAVEIQDTLYDKNNINDLLHLIGHKID